MTRPPWSRCRVVVGLLPGVVLTACDAGPQPLRYGRDECAECRMILVDQHYGAELVTRRGKVFKFDDLACLLAHARRNTSADGRRALVVDFNRPDRLLPVAEAWFLHHPKLRSPMSSNVAAFSDEAELAAARRELDGGGNVMRWVRLQAAFP